MPLIETRSTRAENSVMGETAFGGGIILPLDGERDGTGRRGSRRNRQHGLLSETADPVPRAGERPEGSDAGPCWSFERRHVSKRVVPLTVGIYDGNAYGSTMSDLKFSRRQYLSGISAGSVAGLAGCLGGSGSNDELTLAYMPIFPDLQYFVMESEGYLDEIDVEIDAREFTDGPAIVQAYGGGELDAAMFGIVPAMIVIDNGIPAKVTAANIKEPMAIMVDEDLEALWEEHGAGAFDAWADEHGEKFQFGTFPQGSVPDVLLRYWLSEKVGVDPESAVTITEIGGANAVFQAVVNDEIDGTSIMEPVPTRLAGIDSPIRTFRTAAEIMPGQPAAVTLMSDWVRDSEIAGQFLEQHVRATEFIGENPDETAGIVESGIGMDRDLARQALEGPLSNFVTDPREIENGTEIFSRFAHDNGQIDEELSLERIFDHGIYDAL
jgi:NitT/TauT family transport system substrate-binding protein